MMREEIEFLKNEMPRQIDNICDVLRDYEKLGNKDEVKLIVGAIMLLEEGANRLRLLGVIKWNTELGHGYTIHLLLVWWFIALQQQ